MKRRSTTIRPTPVRSSQFERDVKRAEGRGKDSTGPRTLRVSLIRREPLSALHRDHPLRGRWKDYREVHIEPDRLLIHRVAGTGLRLARTGAHADLFTGQGAEASGGAPRHPISSLGTARGVVVREARER